MEILMQSASKSGFFVHDRFQTIVANIFYPKGNGDWYKHQGYGSVQLDAFYDFVAKHQNDAKAEYYDYFKDLTLSLRVLPIRLANGTDCQLEVFECKPNPNAAPKPGTGKHIVYFTGLKTYYQTCFNDITTACKETGAIIHAFNFPGAGRSSGLVSEANDLINAGIGIVRSLLMSGIHPDNIILQGCSFGAAVAFEVKMQYWSQGGIKLRVVMNNTFTSFKAAISDHLSHSFWMPHFLLHNVKPMLQYTGWHITPGKKYRHADPYQCHIQHLGDQTLTTSSLSNKVLKYQKEMKAHRTMSTKRAAIQDTCPEEYKAARDQLDKIHIVRIKENAKARLAKKFGVDPSGPVNTHYAELCELETIHGSSVYEEFINQYIKASDIYIAGHPQINYPLDAVRYLSTANSRELVQKEIPDAQQLAPNRGP